MSTCDITGLWHGMSGNTITGSVSIKQNGNVFYFSNPNGGANQGQGSYTSQNTINARYLSSSMTGTLSDNCNTINWSNGGVWKSASSVGVAAPAPSVPKKQTLKNVTSSAECAAAGGYSYNYCPETGTYYCCGVDPKKGYKPCDGTNAKCPSDPNLLTCGCPKN